MRTAVCGAAALLLTTAPVIAGGIERSNQSIGILFEEGRYFEAGAQLTRPSVSGRDVAAFGGNATGDVAENFSAISFGYKADINEQLSYAIILDQPYGADIAYPLDGSVALGGTSAVVDGLGLTGILRYRMPNNFGVHGGVRVSRADAEVTLSGAAYGGVNGYNVDLAPHTAAGWLAGFSWERPEIAARVALTYFSSIKHEFDTVERIGTMQVAPPSVTEVETPRAINLDFQTGVAPGTLVFGQIRHVRWSDFQVDPAWFTPTTGGGLVDLEDTTTYTLGVGRQINDQFSASASISYEPDGDDLVSPLAPTNGRLGVTLAGIYTMDNMKITTGINYTRLGDASPETGTPDTARARMTDNDAISVGVRVGFRF